MDKKRPNILIIMCDQLRYDTFSYMRHPVLKTPNIDRLVREGILFSDAICSCPVCGPSRGSMLTGLYPTEGHYREINVEPFDAGKFWRKDLNTIDEILSGNGYHVEYHGKWHCGSEHRECYKGDRNDFAHVLDDYHNYLEERYEKPEGPEYKIEKYTRWPYRYWPIDELYTDENCDKYAMWKESFHGIMDVEDEDTITAYTVNKTLKFINEYEGDTPFAVTCSILAPHLPFTPNAKYANIYNPEDIPLPENLYDTYDKVANVMYSGHKLNPVPECITPNALKQRLACYYGLIHEIDDYVGLLLKSLEEKNILDDTLIIFCSDHGSMMGSHGLLAKMVFFEESIRVPLIMRYPQKINAGQVSNAAVTGVDIGPTILDYCNIKNKQKMHGISLKNVIETGEFKREYAFSTLWGNHCVRSNKWKIIYENNVPQMIFDMENDPYEKKNLLDEKKSKLNAQDMLKKEAAYILSEKYDYIKHPEFRYVFKQNVSISK